jgi:hypothetical protein
VEAVCELKRSESEAEAKVNLKWKRYVS